MLAGWPEDVLHFNFWAGPRLAPTTQRSQQSQSSSHTRQDGSRRGQYSGRIHNLDSPVLITVIFSLLTRAGYYNSSAHNNNCLCSWKSNSLRRKSSGSGLFTRMINRWIKAYSQHNHCCSFGRGWTVCVWGGGLGGACTCVLVTLFAISVREQRWACGWPARAYLSHYLPYLCGNRGEPVGGLHVRTCHTICHICAGTEVSLWVACTCVLVTIYPVCGGTEASLSR